jgi:transcriptional regulator with XRE-family HTH domain
MTHAELGQKLGVTESYASYLRAGKRMPSAEVLSRMIEVFNFDERTTYGLMKAYREGSESLRAYLEKALPRVDC